MRKEVLGRASRRIWWRSRLSAHWIWHAQTAVGQSFRSRNDGDENDRSSEDRFDTNRNSCAFPACPLRLHAVDAEAVFCAHSRKGSPGPYVAASLGVAGLLEV